MGQHAPTASAAVEIEDGVDDLAQISRAGPPARFGRRQQGLDYLPLRLREIAGIGAARNPNRQLCGLCPELRHVLCPVL